MFTHLMESKKKYLILCDIRKHFFFRHESWPMTMIHHILRVNTLIFNSCSSSFLVDVDVADAVAVAVWCDLCKKFITREEKKNAIKEKRIKQRE